MDFILICATALIFGCLTLFAGFGFGTLMLPVFALFFPVDVAVAATAVVHFTRQVFKVAVIGKWANRAVVLRFAPPAAVGALVGAWLLQRASALPALATYTLDGRAHAVTPIKVTMAVLILAAAAFEVVPRLERLSASRRWLPVGGALSGFFGGLSGHQGALRMAFLRRWNLSKEALLGTSAVCSLVIDAARLAVYGATEAVSHRDRLLASGLAWLVGAACVSAFVGSLVGARLVKRVSMTVVRIAMTVMLVVTALLLGAGLI